MDYHEGDPRPYNEPIELKEPSDGEPYASPFVTQNEVRYRMALEAIHSVAQYSSATPALLDAIARKALKTEKE